MLTVGPLCDPSTLAPTAAPALLDPADLTRHAVCVGMTGSGKTGLCVQLLEEVVRNGTPILAIDPKGDLTNLALTFDDLQPATLAPWVDPSRTPDEVSAAWTAGLAADGRTADDIRRWRLGANLRVLTPGSDAGIPIDVTSALSRAPAGLDEEGLREFVAGVVAALLGLLGQDEPRLTDPDAILLTRLLGDAFAAGEEMPLDRLIPAVADPPFDQLGCLPLETQFPRVQRMELARKLNAVIANPTFAGWRRGVPLDVEAWFTPDAKTPVTILYLAHLDDAQRMFFVTLVLHAVVAWSRRQPGSAALRAMLYFDEVMGYLPPHPRTPPSKGPVLTLLKQARGVGLGVMLTTQNPVDVDYKALSNAATWFVGRLQTKQDRARVLDGLERTDLDELLARLPPRTFVLRDGSGLRVLRSRHTMALLRGPLTRREVAMLGQVWDRPAEERSSLLRSPPVLPAAITSRWLADEGHVSVGIERGDPVVWRPALYGRLQMAFDGEVRLVHRLRLPADDGAPAEVALQDAWLLRKPPAAGVYEPAPAVLSDDAAVDDLRDAWVHAVVREETAVGPDGRAVYAKKSAVEVLGFVVLWVRG